MSETGGEGRQQTPGPLPQTPPPFRTLGEIDIAQMIFELQGSFGEVKGAMNSLQRAVESDRQRIEGIERTTTDIKNALNQLIPKIEDVAGFLKHGVPNLATKHDLEKIKSDLKLRPTRRQAIFDIGWVVTLITAAVSFGSRVAH